MLVGLFNLTPPEEAYAFIFSNFFLLFLVFFIFSGPWVLVGLFNLTTREDARAVALSHLPMGRMEERRAAGGGGRGGKGRRGSGSGLCNGRLLTRPRQCLRLSFGARSGVSCVCSHICVYVCMCVCAYVCMCMCVHVHIPY